MNKIFKVSGSGEFPADMLRHDGAFPYTSADARILQEAFKARVIDSWEIVLESSFSYAPTVARWKSFLIKTEKL